MRGVEDLINNSLNFFLCRDYLVHANISITTDDPTLNFVNSSIAVFKNQLLQGEPLQKTVLVQDCFKTNSNIDDSLIFFRMLGLHADGQKLEQVFSDLISYLVDIAAIPLDCLYAVIHQDDHDLFQLWQEFGKSEQVVRISGNTNKFFSRWNYGTKGILSGRGLTIVYQDSMRSLCSSSCNIHCHCLKFVQIGNIVRVKNNVTGNEYLDFGFGVERLVGYHYAGNLFVIPNFEKVIIKIQQIGFSLIDSRQLFNYLRAIFKLISEGVLPGNRGGSYVLKFYIRQVVNTVIQKQSNHLNEVVKIVEQLLVAYSCLISQLNFQFEIITQSVEKYLQSIRRGMRKTRILIKSSSSPNYPEIAQYCQETLGLPFVLVQSLLTLK